MHYAVYKAGILVQMLQLFIAIRCECPEYFRYFRNETTGEIMGTVEIPTPPQGVALHLRVILSVATVLPTKYVGRLELAKSKEESIRGVLQGLPLYYQIYFPVRNPIPVVTSITLNDVRYCTGRPVVGMIVTNIMLEHTLYPPRVIIPLTEQLLNFISNHTNTSTTSSSLDRPADRRTTVFVDDKETTTMMPSDFQTVRPLKHKPVDSSCGLTNRPNPLIAIDELTLPAVWPWLAAIFVIKAELEFQCNGNLISRQHVLTVAHCLKEDDENIPSNLLIISLGRFNLRDWKEPGSVNIDVIKYKFHPDYRNSVSADSDLAIIKLTDRVDYTPSIRPICLWMGKPELDNVVGKSGYVIGWERNERNKQDEFKPHVFSAPILSQADCLQSNAEFTDIMSNGTFCAVKGDGRFCSGNVGSGFVMFHMRYGRYHLRGIASFPNLHTKTISCNTKSHAVYVDVAKYLTWIRQEILS